MSNKKTNYEIITWLENMLLKREVPGVDEGIIIDEALCVRYGGHIFTRQEWDKYKEALVIFLEDLEEVWDFIR